MRSDNKARAAIVAFTSRITHFLMSLVRDVSYDAPYQKKPRPEHVPHQSKRERERRLRQMAKLNDQ